MKKFSLLLLSTLMALCLFTACGDDEEETGGTTEASIVGTWVTGERSFEVKTNSTVADELLKMALNEDIVTIESATTFKEDGTGITVYEDEDDQVFTYTAENGVLTMNGIFDGDEPEVLRHNYAIDGNKLIITSDLKSDIDAEYLEHLEIENPTSITVEKVLLHVTFNKK